ncbi:MAG: hypothetical protein K1X72_24480 [Pyrinomonadaceae bacterium]|nr:hypothetical protein [Pyrinomonadaceae bacterium]
MNFEINQSLQQKLERRIERLKNVDGRYLSSSMKQFFNFLNNEPILEGILSALEIEMSLNENTKSFHNWEDMKSLNNENELLKLSLIELQNLANSNYGLSLSGIASNFGFESPNNLDKSREFIFLQLIKPFCDYIIEQLSNQQTVLSFIQRYKHRSEWFRQSELKKIHDDEMKKKQDGEKKRAFVEDRLASDLYSYLYDEGINFHISPSSITGRIDLIEEGKRPLLEAQSASSHRLLADAKVFDGEARNASYLGKGFGQIISYCKKYNESFGLSSPHLLSQLNGERFVVFHL